MNAEQRAALRKVAEEATPGPWNVYDESTNDGLTKYFGVDSEEDGTVVLWDEFGGVIKRKNADHIAAANPSTILQLLDYIETLEKDAGRYQTLKNNDFCIERFVSHSYGWKAVASCDLDEVLDAEIQGERNEHSD